MGADLGMIRNKKEKLRIRMSKDEGIVMTSLVVISYRAAWRAVGLRIVEFRSVRTEIKHRDTTDSAAKFFESRNGVDTNECIFFYLI
jgi:hypothetical protein